MYKTDFYHSRYFNNIVKDKDILIKSSSNVEKIVAEYNYYYFLPNSCQRFFVQPFDLNVSNSLASYKMECINYKNLAELFANGECSDISFDKVLIKIDDFKTNTYTSNKEYVLKQSKNLVLEKTKNRIKDNREYSYLFDKIENAFNTHIRDRTTWNTVLSHGDLCFSNIIWIQEIEMIKFIDPRGTKFKNDIYMDEYYDLAKLSHSIFGGYESILYNKDIDYSSTHTAFLNYLKNKNISLELLKVYEASLFLSMIPLHKDNKNNVNKFILACENILKNLKV